MSESVEIRAEEQDGSIDYSLLPAMIFVLLSRKKIEEIIVDYFQSQDIIQRRQRWRKTPSTTSHF